MKNAYKWNAALTPFPLTEYGPVYMRGETGRLPRWDDARVRTCICFCSFYRILFIWRRDVFRPVSPSRDPGFSNRGPGLSWTILPYK